jgi:NADH:ubiquinone oxidoreductase subunit F (NADH-binding)
VVVDSHTCMVDFARYFLSFTQDESCGKCVPCRVGTRKMLSLLMRMSRGLGEARDIDKLRALCTTVSASSLCGLGINAPNPLLTALRYFEEEFRAHVEDKVCPAGACPMDGMVPVSALRPGGAA